MDHSIQASWLAGMFWLTAYAYTQLWWNLEQLKANMFFNTKSMMISRDLDFSPTHEILHSTTGNRTDLETINLISRLVLAESKLIRTSTITLAAFNILASFTTAASILYDCYWASKKCNPKFKASKFCVSSIHPAETYPLVQSIGIVIQGIIFASVQGVGLNTLFVNGCGTIAQILWPAIFIVPYIQLVFSLECAFRSLKNIPFQARGKYNVSICCGVVILMLFLTWIPSHAFPESNTCFASLLWFVSRYGKLGFVILLLTASLILICAIIIFCRLSAVHLIDQHQRIAASRIVHYMILGIISLTFTLPFFFSLFYEGGNRKLSMMAAVVLNLSGLLSGLLHLILRSNTSTTSFGPKIGSSWDRGRHEIRIFGPNELALYNPLFDPVPGPVTPSSGNDRQSEISPRRVSYIGTQIDLEKLSGQAYSPSQSDKTIVDSPAILTQRITSPVSYSLFPTQDHVQNNKLQPISIAVYDMKDLDIPRPIFATNSRLIRNSGESSATVQIGLRLSHAPTINPFDDHDDDEAFLLPATTYGKRVSEATSPLSPLQLKPTTYSGFQRAVLPPIPLKLETTVKTPQLSQGFPRSPFLGYSTVSNDRNELETPIKSEMMNKVNNINNNNNNLLLKPEDTLSIQNFKSSEFRLAPAVYKPNNDNVPVSKTQDIQIFVTSASETSSAFVNSHSDHQNPPDEKSNWI